jgi:hypothetical protein
LGDTQQLREIFDTCICCKDLSLKGTSRANMVSYANSFDDIISSILPPLDNLQSIQSLSFLLTSYNKYKKVSSYTFHPEQLVTLDSNIAVGFLNAILGSQSIHDKVFQFSFSGIYGSQSAHVIKIIVDTINQLRIDCIPTIHIDSYINEDLLDVLIENKCLFEISHHLTINDLITIKNNQPIDKPIIKIFDKIKNARLPIIYCPVVTQGNVNEMSTMVKFANDNGACGIAFGMNDHLENDSDISLCRPERGLYMNNLIRSLKLASVYGVEIIIHELKRFYTKGEYQSPQKLVLLPDGSIATTKTYKTKQEKGAQRTVIGQFTLDKGLAFFSDKINDITHNVKSNLAKHCINCESFIYCRGRNTNSRLFKEMLTESKDEYRCELTKDIYRLLDSVIQR